MNDLRTRPDGKEVSIFKDNTFDCDYSGYKEIGYNFGDLRRTVMAPESWNGYRFYGDDSSFENMLTGTPIYDGPLPVKIDPTDESTMFKNEPLTKSTFFFAESPWIHAEDFINSDGLINKYDYETYVDKKGRSMKVYFLDGLPKYAVYDDFFFLCIWFNLDSEEQIPIVVNMINSIDVSLSSDAEFALKTAERLGYTIILPENSEDEKSYNDKLEKVIAAHNEVEFVYGKILSIEKTEEGQTRVVVSPNKDMDVNHRKNYSFVIRDNTYLRYGYSDFSKNDLLVGQKVFISFASSFDDTLEYSGGEHSVEVFSLFVLDDDAANPDPLTPQDYEYYDFEVEAEVEVETEVQTDIDDGVLE